MLFMPPPRTYNISLCPSLLGEKTSGTKTSPSEASQFIVTVTTTVSVDLQPFWSVTVRIYVVLTVGDATGLAQVVQLKPLEGLHAYVPPPLPFSVTWLPMFTL